MGEGQQSQHAISEEEYRAALRTHSCVVCRQERNWREQLTWRSCPECVAPYCERCWQRTVTSGSDASDWQRWECGYCGESVTEGRRTRDDRREGQEGRAGRSMGFSRLVGWAAAFGAVMFLVGLLGTGALDAAVFIATFCAIGFLVIMGINSAFAYIGIGGDGGDEGDGGGDGGGGDFG